MAITSKRSKWLIYGATGYSGKRIAQEAASRGYRPVLAARNGRAVKALAEQLGLEWESFDLTDKSTLLNSFKQFSTVLNAAGPFVDTYAPAVAACLSAGANYLDISGEVNVYEALAIKHAEALAANLTIMPGVGFDMVPGDCLALSLKDELPDATELSIGYSFDGTVSRGSARTALATFSPETLVRRGGKLVRLPAPMIRRFDFGPRSSVGSVDCYSMTFGDISIAWRTTLIPDVTSYLHVTKTFQDLATINDMEALAQMPDGPGDQELSTYKAFVVGEARNLSGKVVRMRVQTPQVYASTFAFASVIAQRVHEGQIAPGFQTPATAFGKAFILEFDGVILERLQV